MSTCNSWQQAMISLGSAMALSIARGRCHWSPPLSLRVRPPLAHDGIVKRQFRGLLLGFLDTDDSESQHSLELASYNADQPRTLSPNCKSDAHIRLDQNDEPPFVQPLNGRLVLPIPLSTHMFTDC